MTHLYFRTREIETRWVKHSEQYGSNDLILHAFTCSSNNGIIRIDFKIFLPQSSSFLTTPFNRLHLPLSQSIKKTQTLISRNKKLQPNTKAEHSPVINLGFNQISSNAESSSPSPFPFFLLFFFFHRHHALALRPRGARKST